jgi:phosphatidate cytidylyltransferase
MLQQRILTAIALLAVLLPALFYPSSGPFGALMLILIAAAGWEWARLNGFGGRAALVAGAGCFAAGSVAWAAGWLMPGFSGQWLWIFCALVWVAGGGWILYLGVPQWAQIPANLRLLAGLLLLCLTWLAAVKARVAGINFLLSALALVWAADIFAYFAGKAFGGKVMPRRLAPSISPGKSWEGVWGGAAAVLVLAWVWCWLDSAFAVDSLSLFSRLRGLGWGTMVVVLLILTAMSVVGDLFESLVKRSAGVKDSSGLLPGHGGVLDRVDALLPVLPLTMLLGSL